ncbi:MAG: TetR/AcrR family transcriptional regulator [Mycobacterium sp.]|nr:TetR/AcrR family transcriptional regulator [Mycobacterium sp.]
MAGVSPSRRPRRSDAVENERRVRQAAHDVFATRGRGTTMEAVAESAGVSKGTVYATFGTRQQLIDEMTILGLQQSEQAFREAAESSVPTWEALVEVVAKPQAVFFARPDVSAPDAADNRVHDAFMNARDAFGLLLHKGQQEGLLRQDITIDHIQILFHGMYLAVGEYSVERLADIRQCAEVILRGLLVLPEEPR